MTSSENYRNSSRFAVSVVADILSVDGVTTVLPEVLPGPFIGVSIHKRPIL